MMFIILSFSCKDWEVLAAYPILNWPEMYVVFAKMKVPGGLSPGFGTVPLAPFSGATPLFLVLPSDV